MIIQAKRANRTYKYRDNEIFINDHMSSENKRLFELARSKKKELNFKFLWTKMDMFTCVKMNKCQFIK